MLFMGIDPGLYRTGLGIVSRQGNKLEYIYHAIIKPSKTGTLPERLKNLVELIVPEFKKYEVFSCGIEDLFYSVNVKTALILGQTRGSIIAALCLNNISVYEYTALQIKQSVTGHGKAGKEQVKRMVEMELKIKLADLELDISDALACAICHALNIRSASNPISISRMDL
jgi:crossover junction endodeoxyribonuclease RuvC